MNRILSAWCVPFVALRFTSSTRHSMDELSLGLGQWSDRCLRQKLQTLSPEFALDFDGTGPDEPAEPMLPTPTDVPVPELHDVPVPEPMDVPPPDPRDLPPSQPKRPEFAPKPRSIP